MKCWWNSISISGHADVFNTGKHKPHGQHQHVSNVPPSLNNQYMQSSFDRRCSASVAQNWLDGIIGLDLFPLEMSSGSCGLHKLEVTHEHVSPAIPNTIQQAVCTPYVACAYKRFCQRIFQSVFVKCTYVLCSQVSQNLCKTIGMAYQYMFL